MASSGPSATGPAPPAATGPQITADPNQILLVSIDRRIRGSRCIAQYSLTAPYTHPYDPYTNTDIFVQEQDDDDDGDSALGDDWQSQVSIPDGRRI
jgi:hypothetical protein